MNHEQELPVWYFIGWLLSVYGVVLTAAGVEQYFHPPHTVLSEYHATLWAGLILLALGGTYVLAFRPSAAASEPLPEPESMLR